MKHTKTLTVNRHYMVSYNRHRYQDCSDPARFSSRVVEASSPEDAFNRMVTIRDASNCRALTTPRASFIGLIHAAAITPDA